MSSIVNLNILDDSSVTIHRDEGLNCLENAVLECERFKAGVHVPMGNWSQGQLVTRTRGNLKFSIDGSTVHVFRTPDPLLHKAQKIAYKVAQQHDIWDYQNAFMDFDLSEVIDDIADHIIALGLDYQTISDPLIAVSYAHLEGDSEDFRSLSTTPDPSSEIGIRGLHIDNWEQPPVPLSDRYISKSKLLYNLGVGNRSFVYANLRIDSMTKKLVGKSDQYVNWAKNLLYASPLVEQHLEINKEDINLTRIVLEPGMGIIAPVQNILHDGYLYGSQDVDLCLQARIH